MLHVARVLGRDNHTRNADRFAVFVDH
jgi:hypothetical protein